MNKKQEEAINKIELFIENPSKWDDENTENTFYLMGYAGTGKTYLISNMILDLLRTKIKAVIICAPTHKALSVIKSYIKSYIPPKEKIEYLKKIDFLTIHKLLEFEPMIEKNGNKIFKNKNNSIKKINNKLIIIDECSMISIYMKQAIDKYLEKNPCKIIFMGDIKQLPPVKEIESPIFKDITEKNSIILDEIMRTKSSSIKEISTIIRNWDMKSNLNSLFLSVYKKSIDFKLFHKKKELS